MFSKVLRVADYGVNKLVQLLDKLPAGFVEVSFENLFEVRLKTPIYPWYIIWKCLGWVAVVQRILLYDIDGCCSVISDIKNVLLGV